MRILLLSPSWSNLYNEFKSSARKAILYPPLGLCYLASVAKSLGHDVLIIDGEVENLNEKLKKTVKQFAPDIIGITSTTPCFHEAKIIASSLKKISSAPILIGGPHASISPDEILLQSPDFDIVVFGEGEQSFSNLLHALNKNTTRLEDETELKKVNGIAFRSKSNEIIKTQKMPFITKLDDLPFPNRGLLSEEAYSWSIPKKGRKKFTTMITSRGCPYHCVFCAERSMFGNYVRFRSAKNVLEEIEQITSRGIEIIGFVDDTFTINKNLVLEICEGIIEKNLKIILDCWTHAATLDKQILIAMKKAGFIRVNIGIESGDNEILKTIKKQTDIQLIKKAFRLSKEVGLETCGYAMLGLPNETKHTAIKTINFMKYLNTLDYGFISIATPLPGTEMYEFARKKQFGLSLLTNDFSKFKRYGCSVISVNDLSSKDLTKLQKRAFISIYLMPHRIIYLLKRAGLYETFINILSFIRSIFTHL